MIIKTQRYCISASMLHRMLCFLVGNGAASAGEAQEWRDANQGLNLLQDGALCEQSPRPAFTSMLH